MLTKFIKSSSSNHLLTSTQTYEFPLGLNLTITVLQLQSDLFVYSPLSWTYQPSSANLRRVKRGSQETSQREVDWTLSHLNLCQSWSPLPFSFLPSGFFGGLGQGQRAAIKQLRHWKESKWKLPRKGALSAVGRRECGEEALYPAPSFCQVVLLEWSVPTLSAPVGLAFLGVIRPGLGCRDSGQKQDASNFTVLLCV